MADNHLKDVPKTEIQYMNPFTHEVFHWLDYFTMKLFRPCKFCLDTFLSGFYPVTLELKTPWVLLPVYFITMPLSLLGFLLTLPLMCFAFCLWYMISFTRLRFYCFSYTKGAFKLQPVFKNTYCVATTNFCLLPEFASRINNLKDLYERAAALSASIADGQDVIDNDRETQNICNGVIQGDKHSRNKDTNNFISDFHKRTRSAQSAVINQLNSCDNKWLHKNGNLQKANGCTCNNNSITKGQIEHSVVAQFPHVDFLLVQETWDKEVTPIIIRQLHRVYPFIIYDIGKDSLESNYYLSNSGLMVASRYPVEEVWYDYFRESKTQCVMASKGLVCLKLYLGQNKEGKKMVGYLANTHLQAYQGTSPVHTHQLNDCWQWLKDFREHTLKPGEVVAFDVFGGDLNLDNMSPVDEQDHDHPIFTDYEDVCRIRPGLNHDWAIGTEMRHIPLHDRQVSTAEGLKEALEDPYLLQHYILDADICDANIEISGFMPKLDENGKPILSLVGGKRLIDYVMFRKGDGVIPLRYNQVTQLAGLTDHIPVALTFQTRSN